MYCLPEVPKYDASDFVVCVRDKLTEVWSARDFKAGEICWLPITNEFKDPAARRWQHVRHCCHATTTLLFCGTAFSSFVAACSYIVAMHSSSLRPWYSPPIVTGWLLDYGEECIVGAVQQVASRFQDDRGRRQGQGDAVGGSRICLVLGSIQDPGSRYHYITNQRS